MMARWMPVPMCHHNGHYALTDDAFLYRGARTHLARVALDEINVVHWFPADSESGESCVWVHCKGGDELAIAMPSDDEGRQVSRLLALAVCAMHGIDFEEVSP